MYTVDVHRLLAAWTEGDGLEFFTPPAGCTGVDPAFGVAWAGLGDNPDPAAANNQTQPPFDPTVFASATVNQAVNVAGDVIQWDITSLVQDWVNGTAPNQGIVLRDVTFQPGVFRGVRFGAREGLQFGMEFAVAGPRLVVTLLPTLTALSPANVWIGLKNSDAVGLRVDVLVEVFVDGDKVGEGGLTNAATGSSGFNNARLHTIPLALTEGPVSVPAEAQLSVLVSVRRTCFGGGHNSGQVRLWYNGQAVDDGAGRDAGSRFDATIGGAMTDYFLRGGFALATEAGGARLFNDKMVNSTVACPGRPFTAFGTWSLMLP